MTGGREGPAGPSGGAAGGLAGATHGETRERRKEGEIFRCTWKAGDAGTEQRPRGSIDLGSGYRGGGGERVVYLVVRRMQWKNSIIKEVQGKGIKYRTVKIVNSYTPEAGDGRGQSQKEL